MLVLTADQLSSFQLYPIQSYGLSKLVNWMCVEDLFLQIRSQLCVSVYVCSVHLYCTGVQEYWDCVCLEE